MQASRLRSVVILCNLISAYKRVGLLEEFHSTRPKRLRFLLFNTVGKVVRHGSRNGTASSTSGARSRRRLVIIVGKV